MGRAFGFSLLFCAAGFLLLFFLYRPHFDTGRRRIGLFSVIALEFFAGLFLLL
jgi:hypothetical protein